QILSRPPGLPVFRTLITFPSTPLYKKLKESGRLTRPILWLEYRPFWMAHTPLKMTIDEAQAELKQAWTDSYSADAIAAAVNSISHQPLGHRINVFIARIFFRGIYFPQMGKMAWAKVIFQN